MMKKNSVFTEMEVAMFTPDLNVKRYLGSSQIDQFGENQMATLNYPNGYGHGTRVHNESIALTTSQTPCVKVKVERERNEFMLRIRKLLPSETMKLMGFTQEDYLALREIGLGDSAIYHVAGDSIITTCLVAILSPLVNERNKHINIIEDYVEKNIRRKD